MAASSSQARMVRGSTLAVAMVLAVALFGLVNYFGWKYHQRSDWTASRLYTLSEKTVNVLGEMHDEVSVVVFMDPSDELYTAVREMLARYEAASSRISVRLVDPVKDAVEARTLFDEYQRYVVLFRRGDDKRVVETTELADYDYSGMEFGGGPEMTGFKGEQLFTGAILELVEGRKPKVMFTTGHGEPSLEDFSAGGLASAKQLLGEDNFEIAEWPSASEPEVPAGTDLVVVAGPQTSFLPGEASALRDYLQTGGRVLALLEPFLSPLGGLTPTGLEELFAEYGISVGQDVVFDPAGRVPLFGPGALLVSEFGDHITTRSLRQAQLTVLLPVARSIAPAEVPAGLESAKLLSTSDEAWGESDLGEGSEFLQDAADVVGPLSLGVAVWGPPPTAGGEIAGPPPAAVGGPPGGVGDEGPAIGDAGGSAASNAGSGESGEAAPTPAEPIAPPSRELRLAVLGDSDFATNGQVLNAANATLLANLLNWLAERETLVAIPPKRPEQVRLSLTGEQLGWITLVVLGILPLAAIVAGVGVWLRRRR